MKKVVLLTILIAILINSVVLNPVVFALAQDSAPIEAPKTLEEAKSLGERFLEGLPEVIKTAFKETFEWLKNLWTSYIFPFLRYIWQKVAFFLRQEVEKRKPEIQEEFEKEKQELKEELKEEVPKVSKTLWQRFKDLIK